MRVESFHDEEVRQKAYDPRLMGRLLRFLRPYRARVACLVGLTLGLALAHVAVPRVWKLAMDGPIATHDPGGILPYGAAYLGIAAGIFLLQAAQSFAMTGLGLRVTRDVRQKVFAHLQGLALPYYDRHPVGRLMTRVMGDVDALNELLSSGIVAAFSDIFLLLGIMVVMVAMHPPLAGATFVSLLLLVPVSLWFRSVAQRLYREIRLRISRLNVVTQENITGMRVVQLFGREGRNFDEFDTVNAEHTVWCQRAIVRHSAYSVTVMFLQVLAISIILGYGGWRMQSGDPAATVGLLVAFIWYARMFFQPIMDLTDKYNILLAAMASSERIFQLLDTDERIREVPTPRRLRRAKGEVVFEDVWMSYREGTDVLKGVSFRVEAGSRVALVGHTGTGKTSVISALFRFYEIRRGRILLDGIPVSDLALDDLRRQMALVLQEPFLFSGTILENLRLGRSEIPRGKVEEACRAVRIHDFIVSRGGYDAPVQERGAGFSEGERQLLSFARALVFDPSVLILDEATANVDTRTEMAIQEALKILLRGRTSLVIAHRLSTIRECDRILVFHQGEIREQGTHAELLAHGGLYTSLHALQFREGGVAVRPRPRAWP
ncbi:MAG: ABC transporter ATP-binding protein [Planctomycetes bacterium]|nr:ABC transporter ATP-binding protein [Planctomycetota bacterium]